MVQSIAISTVAFALASGTAAATTIFSSQSVMGTIAPTLFSAPPNPNNTGTATFNGFDQAAANAAISAACPVGFTCSTAALYEIDLSVTAATSGSLTIRNMNDTPQQVSCFMGNCATGPASSGIAAEGVLSLSAKDPLAHTVMAVINAVTFTVPTTVIDPDSGKVLVVNPGDTIYSANGSINTGTMPIYASSTDGAAWLPEAAAYSGGTVTLNLKLSGGAQVGMEPNGVGVADSVSSITAGTVNAFYLFSYEQAPTLNATTETPEPATLLLMGSALAGIGFLRKRAK